MEQNLKLIDVYEKNKEGDDLLTKNGNRYITLLLGDGDDVVYESVFFTKKAHWVSELIFDAFGSPCPHFEAIAKKQEDDTWVLNIDSFKDLVGHSCQAVIGENKGGYKTIIKWVKYAVPTDIEVRDNDTDASEDVQDKIDNSFEPEDDIPF